MRKKEDKLRNKIVFFDLDGTLTYKDTFLEFVYHTHGKLKTWVKLLQCGYILLLWKISIVDSQRLKEKLLLCFYKGIPLSQWQDWCTIFANNILPSLLRKEALKTIFDYQQKGFQCVIVSASISDWIEPWAKTLNMKVLGTSIEKKDHLLIGSIRGRNNEGIHKVEAIQKTFKLEEFKVVHVYGNSCGDKEMLELASKGHAYYQAIT